MLCILIILLVCGHVQTVRLKSISQPLKHVCCCLKTELTESVKEHAFHIEDNSDARTRRTFNTFKSK